MRKYLIFFFVIGAAGFVFFSYITYVSKSMQSQSRPGPSETEKILADQSAEIKRLNQNYRDIIEQSKRGTQDATRQITDDAVRRDIDRTLEDNRRQIEDNRRHMEQLRREMKMR